MLFAWSQVCTSWLEAACLGGLLLGLSVVVPVAECADVVDCGAFAWLPLCEVCGFEVCGGGAPLPGVQCCGALVSVTG